MGIIYILIKQSSKRALAIACDILSKYYPIVMKFSVHLPFYEDASAVDFAPDFRAQTALFICLYVKTKENRLYRAYQLTFKSSSQRCGGLQVKQFDVIIC